MIWGERAVTFRGETQEKMVVKDRHQLRRSKPPPKTDTIGFLEIRNSRQSTNQITERRVSAWWLHFGFCPAFSQPINNLALRGCTVAGPVGMQGPLHPCIHDNLGLNKPSMSCPNEQFREDETSLSRSHHRNALFKYLSPSGSALLLTHREYTAQAPRAATRASSVLFSFFPFLQPTTSSTTDR